MFFPSQLLSTATWEPGSADISGLSEDKLWSPQLHSVGYHGATGQRMLQCVCGVDLEIHCSPSWSQVFFLDVHRMFPMEVEVNLPWDIKYNSDWPYVSPSLT